MVPVFPNQLESSSSYLVQLRYSMTCQKPVVRCLWGQVPHLERPRSQLHLLLPVRTRDLDPALDPGHDNHLGSVEKVQSVPSPPFKGSPVDSNM